MGEKEKKRESEIYAPDRQRNPDVQESWLPAEFKLYIRDRKCNNENVEQMDV